VEAARSADASALNLAPFGHEAELGHPPAPAPQSVGSEAVSRRGLNGLAPAAAALESAKKGKQRADIG